MAAPDFVASGFYVDAVPLRAAAHRFGSRSVLRSAFPVVEAATDFVVCVAGMAASSALASVALARPFLMHDMRQVVLPAAGLGLMMVFLLFQEGTYRKSAGLLQIRETERVIRASTQAVILLVAFRLLAGLDPGWVNAAIAIAVIPLLLIVERHIWRIGLRSFLVKTCLERTVIYGSGEPARQIVSLLLQSARVGLNPVMVVDEAAAPDSLLEIGYKGRRSIPLMHTPVTGELLDKYQCALLLVAAPELGPDQLVKLSSVAEQSNCRVAMLRAIEVDDTVFNKSFEIDGFQFFARGELGQIPLNAFTRRVVDLVVSSVLIVLLAPLFLLIALCIRLDSKGPALFVQKRIGLFGEAFSIFKFRSMFVGVNQYERSPSSSSDPRITRIGRFLRRMSLDELPQLFNVFNGTMSLVGPRPEMPFIVNSYDARQRLRLNVKPGITGLWQLSADRAFPIHANIEYDLYYIRNRTISMDAAILIHTVIFALCGGI